jgi:carbamoyltransferase
MHTFFDMTSSSHEHMALCPTVKEKYREVLKSITHVDGTARLQTTDEHQSPEFYHILANMSQLTEYPILLNTSFNIAGKPILNTYRDAIWMLENTQMDGLILEDYYITK